MNMIDLELADKYRLMRKLEAEVLHNPDLDAVQLSEVYHKIARLRIMIAFDEQQEQEYNKQRKGHRFVMR